MDSEESSEDDSGGVWIGVRTIHAIVVAIVGDEDEASKLVVGLGAYNVWMIVEDGYVVVAKCSYQRLVLLKVFLELEIWLCVPMIRKEDVEGEILCIGVCCVVVIAVVIAVVTAIATVIVQDRPVQEVELELKHDRFLVQGSWLPGERGEVGVCGVYGKGIDAEDAHHTFHALRGLCSPEGNMGGGCMVVVGVVLDDEVVVGLELDGGHGEEEEYCCKENKIILYF